MHASWILAAALGLFFTALGTAKVLSLPPMRQRAEHLGFTAAAYRVIGVCELAGAAGLAIGLVAPVLGDLAAAGLLLLLAGALGAHLRSRDKPREAASAVVVAVLVAAYLAVLLGAP